MIIYRGQPVKGRDHNTYIWSPSGSQSQKRLAIWLSWKLAPESKENEELKQRRWERKRGKKGNERNHYFLTERRSTPNRSSHCMICLNPRAPSWPSSSHRPKGVKTEGAERDKKNQRRQGRSPTITTNRDGEDPPAPVTATALGPRPDQGLGQEQGAQRLS